MFRIIISSYIIKKYRVFDISYYFFDGKIIFAGMDEFRQENWLFPVRSRKIVHRRFSRRSAMASATQCRCDLERCARGRLRLNRTARIPRTCVNRSTAPHFNRPMHIRPSLATFNEPSEGAHRATEARSFNRDPLLIVHASPRGSPRVGCIALFRD